MANEVEIERERLRDRLAQLTEVAERLTADLDRVRDEQGKIDYALSVLDRVAGTATGTDSGHESTVQQPDNLKPVRRRSRQTYDLAVKTISSSTRTWRVDELVRQMREDGWDVQVKNETEAVRAALSRAVADGDIARPGYGVYGPKRGLPGEASPGDAGPEHGRAPLRPDPVPQTSSLTDARPGGDEPQAVGRNGQDMYGNSSNAEPVSHQTLGYGAAGRLGRRVLPVGDGDDAPAN